MSDSFGIRALSRNVVVLNISTCLCLGSDLVTVIRNNRRRWCPRLTIRDPHFIASLSFLIQSCYHFLQPTNTVLFSLGQSFNYCKRKVRVIWSRNRRIHIDFPLIARKTEANDVAILWVVVCVWHGLINTLTEHKTDWATALNQWVITKPTTRKKQIVTRCASRTVALRVDK